jgi:hypothetical protein
MKFLKKLSNRVEKWWDYHGLHPEWQDVVNELRRAGPDMSTTARTDPVRMNLCSICANIDVEMKGWTEARAVRCPWQLFSNHNCDMCKFFVRFLEVKCAGNLTQALKQSDAPLRLAPIELAPNALQLETLGESTALGEALGQLNWIISSTLTNTGHFQNWLGVNPYGREYQNLPEFRVMNVAEAAWGSIDIDLVISWLSDCDFNHDCLALADRPLQAGELQLIDVETREIVSSPAGARYLALSYVWGNVLRQPDYGMVEVPDGSRKIGRASRTIEDAIWLTKSFHERYLWVDVYCVDQSKDSPEKLAQVSGSQNHLSNEMQRRRSTVCFEVWHGVQESIL